MCRTNIKESANILRYNGDGINRYAGLQKHHNNGKINMTTEETQNDDGVYYLYDTL